ncbi:MAG: hypothetical protein CMH54_11865 [Myxococcales bacterium]|nr:hypothetical protein [Myxococcales bacterium]
MSMNCVGLADLLEWIRVLYMRSGSNTYYVKISAAWTLALIVLFTQGRANAREAYVWEDVSLGLVTKDLTAVSILPNDPNVVLVGGSGAVFRTNDAGDSWRLVLRVGRGVTEADDSTQPEEKSTEEEDFEEAAERIFNQLRQEIEDRYGSSYAESIESELRSDAEQQAREEVRAIGADSKEKARQRQGLTAEASDRRIRRIRTFADLAGVVLICTEGGLFHSIDAGHTFRRVSLGLGAGRRVVNDVLALGDGTLVVGTAIGVVIRSPDGRTQRSRLPRSAGAVRVVQYHQPSGRVLIGTDDGIWASEDAGLSFRRMVAPTGKKVRQINDLIFLPHLPDMVLGATDDGLLRSRDGGRSFQQTWLPALGQGAIRQFGAVAQRQEIHLVTPLGVFQSQDGGISLVEIEAGLTDRDVRAVSAALHGERLLLWIATHSGVFRYVPRSEVKMSRRIWRVFEAFQMEEPSLNEVLELATDRAHMNSSAPEDFARKIRLASLGPRVRFEHDRAYERNVNQLTPFDPFNPALGQTITVVPGVTDTRFTVYIDLENYLFSHQEMLVQEYNDRLIKRRRRYRTRVIRLFLSRRALMLNLLGGRPRGKAMNRRIQRLAAITAILDGLTGYKLDWADPVKLLSTLHGGKS